MIIVLLMMLGTILMGGCGQEEFVEQNSIDHNHSSVESTPLSNLAPNEKQAKERKFIRVAKPALPISLNEDTVWVDQYQSEDGSVLTFVYETPYLTEQYTVNGVDLESVIAVAKSCIAGELAHLSGQQSANPDSTLTALRQGMTFNYIYKDTKGNSIYEVNVTKADVFGQEDAP